MDHIAQFQRNVSLWRAELASVKAEIAFRRILRTSTKAGFNEDQPRDDDGRWTDGGGETNPSVSIEMDQPSGSLEEIVQLIGSLVTIDFSNALTGIQSIDETTKSLSEILAKTMQTVDFIPTPREYGTAVHVAFGTMVRFEGLPGIGFNDVEHSFNSGISVDYGEPGSIRTDVVFRNEVGDIMAIYDVKTGNAGLTSARVQEIREKTGTSASVPIIELQVNRGASIKSASKRWLGAVTATLWTSLFHRDN